MDQKDFNSVAVTGISLSLNLGNRLEEIWNNIKNQKAPFTKAIIENKTHLIARCNLEASPYHKEDKTVQMADYNIRQALDDAGLNLTHREGTVLIIGCTKGASQLFSQTVQGIKKAQDFPAETLPRLSSNYPNAFLSKEYKIPYQTAPNAACATGAHVLKKAIYALQQKQTKRVIACMTEASLTPEIISGFDRLGVLSKKGTRSKPFDRFRNGFNIGEGSACMILEKTKNVIQEEKPFYGTITNIKTATDAEHLTTFPNGLDTLKKNILNTLQKTGLSLKDLDHINLHGTGTLANDDMEANLWNTLLPQNNNCHFSATKPYTGHLLGATGFQEQALSFLLASNKWIPPILNTDQPIPEIASLNYVFKQGIRKDINHFLNVSYGIGSTIACILAKVGNRPSLEEQPNRKRK